jgi:hypothetical protein
MRLSRDLLVRGITYKLQERAYGGLSKAAARKLEAGVDSLSRGSVTPAPPISLRPGTRLVREWRGVTHMVLIHADGIEWRGQRYRSLSLVARKITGARTPRLNISVVIRPASTSPLSLIARNKFARVVAILLAGVSIPCPFVIPNYRHYKARGQFRNGPFISGSLKASAWCASQWGGSLFARFLHTFKRQLARNSPTRPLLEQQGEPEARQHRRPSNTKDPAAARRES